MVERRQGVTNINSANALIRRVKLYNKYPMHLLQTAALHKKISMGLPALHKCSSSFYQRLQVC